MFDDLAQLGWVRDTLAHDHLHGTKSPLTSTHVGRDATPNTSGNGPPSDEDTAGKGARKWHERGEMREGERLENACGGRGPSNTLLKA